MKESFRQKVLLVEDDTFTRALLSSTLDKSGIEVQSCASAAVALDVLKGFEPHAVITDLVPGLAPNGLDLLELVAQETPWIGMAIFSSHSSPILATKDSNRIPEGTVFVAKSDIGNTDDLVAIVQSTIERREFRACDTAKDSVLISPTYGEVLRLIAAGLSNVAIANERGTSVRAAEAMVQRTFLALGIRSDANINARVMAVRMWHQGKVKIL